MSVGSAPPRIGLCGAGYWAGLVHAPALAALADVAFAGVWSRNSESAAAVGREHGVAVFSSFEQMLGEVDAVSFAVPPQIQAELGVACAGAGKAALFEKPMAQSVNAADRLAAAYRGRGVPAMVYLTRLFMPDTLAFIGAAREAGADRMKGVFAVRAMAQGSPYSGSSWRREAFGGLWDLGPHVLSVLEATLGPVHTVSAQRVRAGLFTADAAHRDGVSQIRLDMMDPAVEGVDERYSAQGPLGSSRAGPFVLDRVAAYTRALRTLVEATRGGALPPACGLEAGRRMTAVLQAMQASAEAGGRPQSALAD